ncbi:aldolase catalytic domain-containing protein [Aliarcobacter butzleri]|uniref:Aldolase catalytic domain-containing protein n=2 Tax=root TaxID=1 RepID=A0AAP4UL68_9BACT|nr:aldolase catalytic domain-containing protein [Aliarcobacter butzleri]KLD96879.1 nucleoid-structuring protein H-NS [Aliarcobacter butzleri L349]KLE10571.1 nucleoid-structuring protein H-NS [Aliarcobacter butzleri L354]MBF7066524.1 nucleoid-structuring protein H-NS [Aliarcobacter butzleri]MCG3652771.1 aldolase catalytic domain-containing protein [Aliarcobacter butzleri]MCG3659475.1 aldolase catalytic domain-containing protein [Aliarcobacter butzleri]
MIEKKGSILSVREDIKVFDCTIRDGGLVNNYHFSDEFVKAHYETCLAAGVDYMEIGKNVSPTIMSEAEYGPWNFCKEEDIRRIVGENKTNMKIAVMSDIGRSLKEELRPKSESVVDMIRIATYIHQIPAAIELIEDAHAKGYETTVNIMAISKSFDDELDEVLEQLSKTNVDVIYIADSFGSFYPEQIKKLTEKYLSFAQKTGKKVGIHAHNNLQLAYANTLESMIYGTSFLDVTISGLGRGAGNCPLELLIGFLKNPKYKLTPVLKFIEEYIVPLEKELDWGYSIPYMITGQLNEHPRAAMKARDEKDTKYREFYKSLTIE